MGGRGSPHSSSSSVTSQGSVLFYYGGDEDVQLTTWNLMQANVCLSPPLPPPRAQSPSATRGWGGAGGGGGAPPPPPTPPRPHGTLGEKKNPGIQQEKSCFSFWLEKKSEEPPVDPPSTQPNPEAAFSVKKKKKTNHPHSRHTTQHI